MSKHEQIILADRKLFILFILVTNTIMKLSER